jgi:glycosyltransferase involved in cell wall biosynthesis
MKQKTQIRKIALIYDAIYPYVTGGAEKRNYELSKRLAQNGYEVHIYGMKWWKGNNIIKKEDVYLHGLCKPMALYTKDGKRSILQALYFGINCFKLIREDLDIVDADHMPFFSLFSLKLVTLLKRKKLYATWNEVWGRKYWVEYLGTVGNIAYLVEYLSARLPDKIIAVSEHTRLKLIHDLHIGKEIAVVTNGIDLRSVQESKPSKVKSDVIYAGRLLAHKNVDVLIQSISLLKKTFPTITCIIVGNGPQKEALKDLVNKLKLQKNVIFYDFLKEHKDLLAFMKASKVFAFPSTREGFGMAALEANATGLPVITTKHKDNATKHLIVSGINGDVVNLTSTQIAEKTMKYLTVKAKRNQYITVAKQYDWDVKTQELIKVYNNE